MFRLLSFHDLLSIYKLIHRYFCNENEHKINDTVKVNLNNDMKKKNRDKFALFF